ncbi:MAG: hypothetical protein IKB30_02330 [Clostridia bacterium]|nr:hypothetical protein [Clostridia bacterium]
MMTLQQFINLHPNIVQYDRAGVEGIDLDALHERINNSRFLRTRQSFVYFVKNYNRIISGEFDDFKEDIVEVKIDPQTQKEIERSKMYLANVNTFIERISEYKLGEFERWLLEQAGKVKEYLKKAIELPVWSITASVEYKLLIKEIKECLGWIKENGGKTAKG